MQRAKEKSEGGTYLEGRLEDDHISRTLNPRLSIHLNGHVGVQVYLNMATLRTDFHKIS